MSGVEGLALQRRGVILSRFGHNRFPFGFPLSRMFPENSE